MKKENFASTLLMKLMGMILLASFAFAAPEAPKAYVAVGTVSSTHNIVQHRYTGRIVSPAKVDLIARISGEMKEMGFEEGTFVEEGQVMYKLDDVPYKAAVLSAEAQLAEVKAKAEYAEQTYNRVQDLYNKQVTSKDAFDTAKSALAVARAAVQAADEVVPSGRHHRAVLHETRGGRPVLEGVAGEVDVERIAFLDLRARAGQQVRDQDAGNAVHVLHRVLREIVFHILVDGLFLVDVRFVHLALARGGEEGGGQQDQDGSGHRTVRL